MSSIQQSLVVVSMSKNATVHFDITKNRQLHSTENVAEFAVINRQTVPGQIQCEETVYEHELPTLNIPALPLEVIETIYIKILEGERLEINHAHTDEFQLLENRTQNALAQLNEQKLQQSKNELCSKAILIGKAL
jgi:hypothetical protein